MIWPYEEVLAQFIGKKITLSTPWISVSVEKKIPKDQQDKFNEVILTGPKSIQDMVFVNRVSAPFEKFPLFYMLPRAELVEETSIKVYDDKPPLKSDSVWQTEEILSKSKISENQYDLKSILSCVRRQHLLSMVNDAQENSMSQTLAEIHSKKSIKGLLLVIRQNDYIIKNFLDLIKETRQLNQKAESESDQALPSLVHFMLEAKKWSERNILSLAFTLDLLERSVSLGKDSISNLLKEFSSKHIVTSLPQGCANQSFNVLDSVGSVSEAYARQAIDSAKYLNDLFLEFLAERAKKSLDC